MSDRVPRTLKVCVYCGSSSGDNIAFEEVARELGRLLAGNGLGLIYGGGSTGVMGILADACLEAGGQVEGVVPKRLFSEAVLHDGLTRCFRVDSMHARKALMIERADAMVALPGGLGTLEELFEALTWSQIGLHRKPVALLNVAGYYDRLLGFLEHATRSGFISESHRSQLLRCNDPGTLVEMLLTHSRPAGSNPGMR